MKAIEATAPLLGFDTNHPIDPASAARFVAAGYRFAVRYLPRVTPHVGDLTKFEVELLLDAGLAVMAVQHVESESSWVPTVEKGNAYGVAAARAAIAAGLPLDVMVWCDLEGVDTSISADQVAGYCSAWYNAVIAYGFTPGLYVGWHSGLTPAQLYALPFSRYWAAYNLNADEQPAVRGVCMQQHACKAPDGCGEIDSNTIHADKLGGLPILCIPDTW